jgi:hypothetical protein
MTIDHSVLMKCGCRGSATWKDGVCCPVHFPSIESTMIVESPNLEGRKARCNGQAEVDSSLDLAFFEYLPDKEFDRYYCGCRGWD